MLTGELVNVIRSDKSEKGVLVTKNQMNTRIFQINPRIFDSSSADISGEEMVLAEEALKEAAKVLRVGGLVAFPTETVYGLGAAIHREEGIRRIFHVKGRPADNPLILHLYSEEQLSEVVSEIPQTAKILAEEYWPGPLTLVLPKKETVPAEVSAGLPTVAVRIPAHPVAIELLAKTGIPVAAPSANLSGRPSPTLGSHVITDLNGKVELILDAGPTGVGVESTVLDLSGDHPRLLRPGGVTLEMLETTLGKGAVESSQDLQSDRPLAPGMKYRHYAPDAPLFLFIGDEAKTRSALRERVEEERGLGRKVAILAFEEDLRRLSGSVNEAGPSDLLFCSLGRRNYPEEAANCLFTCLRRCNQEKAEVIYAVAPERKGMGEAVFNRLWKAAGGNVVEVN